MGLTEGHWFEEEDTLNERQLENEIEYGEKCYQAGYQKGYADALASRPTISGWISVKDRLPPQQDIVIVAINDDSGDMPYRYTYFGWYMYEAACWIVDDEIRRGEVYAWMPLPEPPKENNK